MAKKTKIETIEEQAVIDAVEAGEFVSLEPKELAAFKTVLQGAAKNTVDRLSKRKAISIRLLENDIARLKAMALSEGMPYQTYISYIIHKIASGEMKAS
ncbi:MAG: hypothetical protein AB7E49_00360 [Campylobacterales bacterium]